MIKVGTSAKLPLKVCKGSVDNRFQLAKQYNEKFFNSICNRFKNKRLDKDVYAGKLNEIHDGKINFAIKDSNPYDFNGCVEPMLDKSGTKVVSYDIYLPLSQQDDKINLRDVSTFMHEDFHYFVETANPKFVKRQASMHEKGLRGYAEPFYKNILYTSTCYDEKYIKKVQLPEFLKHFSISNQIEILQSFRFRLTEEMHAFREGAKYYNKVQDIYKESQVPKFPCEDGSSFHFDEKIKIIEEILANTLAKARKKL